MNNWCFTKKADAPSVVYLSFTSQESPGKSWISWWNAGRLPSQTCIVLHVLPALPGLHVMADFIIPSEVTHFSAFRCSHFLLRDTLKKEMVVCGHIPN